MEKQILTLHPDYRECILDIDIFGRIISTPQQSLEEMTETLFEEFKLRNPMPTLESKRYELSRLVSPDYQVSYDGELELQDGESLVDLPGGMSSMPPLDFEDLSPLVAEAQECFRYEEGVTDDIRKLIIEKFDLSTGEEFKPGIHQTENIVGSTQVERSTYLSDEEIDRLGQDDGESEELAESSEPSGGIPSEVPDWLRFNAPEGSVVLDNIPAPEVDEDRVVSDEWDEQQGVGEGLVDSESGADDAGEDGDDYGDIDLGFDDNSDGEGESEEGSDGESEGFDDYGDLAEGAEEASDGDDYGDLGEGAQEGAESADEEEESEGDDYGDIYFGDEAEGEDAEVEDTSGEEGQPGYIDTGQSAVASDEESEDEGEDGIDFGDFGSGEEESDGEVDDYGDIGFQGEGAEEGEPEGEAESEDEGDDYGDIGFGEEEGDSEGAGEPEGEAESEGEGDDYGDIDFGSDGSEDSGEDGDVECEDDDIFFGDLDGEGEGEVDGAEESEDDSGVDFGEAYDEPEPAPAPPPVRKPVQQPRRDLDDDFFVPTPPPPPPRKPAPPPVQQQAPVVDRSSEPTDIRAFVRKHPRCDIQFALQYFTKKQIDDAVRLGRIIKKGNTLR